MVAVPPSLLSLLAEDRMLGIARAVSLVSVGGMDVARFMAVSLKFEPRNLASNVGFVAVRLFMAGPARLVARSSSKSMTAFRTGEGFAVLPG